MIQNTLISTVNDQLTFSLLYKSPDKAERQRARITGSGSRGFPDNVTSGIENFVERSSPQLFVGEELSELLFESIPIKK